MTGSVAPVRNSDADLISFQRDLIRTQQYKPLGRARHIAIGPSDHWRPKDPDAYLAKYGRLLDFRGMPMPIAQAGEVLLMTAPLTQRDGRVGLPDVPEPDWKPEAYTLDEVEGRKKRDPKKNQAPMIAQRMTDRCEMVDGQPAVLEGTDFLIFQPVLSITFQPELDKQMQPDIYQVIFRPYLGRHCALMVDYKTGDSFFLGGNFEIVKPTGG